MDFQVDFKELAGTVAKQEAFIGSGIDSWTITPDPDRGGIVVAAMDDRRTILNVVEGEGIIDPEKGEDAGITLGAEQFTKVMKIRSKPKLLRIRTVGSRVDFLSKTKSERVVGCIDSATYKEVTVDLKSKGNSVVLDAKGDLRNVVVAAVKQAAISPLFATEPMDIWVRIDVSGVHVGAYDNYHMAYIRDGNSSTKKEVEFAMEKQLLTKLLNLMDDDCKLRVSDSETILVGPRVEARAASLQTKGDGETFSRLKTQVEGVKETQYSTLVMGRLALIEALNSMTSTGDEKEIIEFSRSSDGRIAMQMGSKNRAGYMRIAKEASMTWKSEGTGKNAKPASYSVDKGMLLDVLNLYSGSEVACSFSRDANVLFIDAKNSKDKTRSAYCIGLLT